MGDRDGSNRADSNLGDTRLDDTRWRVSEVAGAPTADDVETTIEFDGGLVFGRAGVNTYRGGYELDGNRLTFGPLATTLMAGPPAAMDQEFRWLRSLGGPMRVEADGDYLVFVHADGERSRLVATSPTTSA